MPKKNHERHIQHSILMNIKSAHTHKQRRKREAKSDTTQMLEYICLFTEQWTLKQHQK